MKLIFPLIFFASMINCFGQNNNDFKSMADVRLNNQDYTGAIVYYTKAIESDPKDDSSVYMRAFAKSAIKDYAGSIQDYTILIVRWNGGWGCIDSFVGRGQIKSIMKDYKGAMEDFNRAIEINPSQIMAYYQRGRLKNNLGDKRGAIADYNMVISISPNYADAYYERALIQIKLGNKENGCSDLSKAGELGKVEAYEAIKKYCN